MYFYNNQIFDFFEKISEKYEFEEEINKILLSSIINISKNNIFTNSYIEYKKVIPFLIKQLSFIENEKEVEKAFFILFKYSEIRENKIYDFFLSNNLHKKLIKIYKEIPLTKYSEEIKLKLKLYTIIILGNIASGDDVQTQILINNGIVDFINELLKESDLKILKNTIWIAESICSGSVGQIACLYEKNTIFYIIQIGIIVYENIIKPNNDKIKNILLLQTFKSVINVICLSITQSLNNEVISVLNYENHVRLSLLVFAIKNYKNDFDFLLLIFQSFHTIKLIEEIIPDSVYLNNDFSYFSFMINNGLGKEIENLCNCPNDNVSREAEYFYHTIILGDDDPDNVLRNSFSVDMDDNNESN